MIIGKQWLDPAAPEGQRRLDDPEDSVRREIEGALQRGIPLIPVLIHEAKVPPANQLPVTLRKLIEYTPVSVRRIPDFAEDMRRLIEAIKQALSPPIATLPLEATANAVPTATEDPATVAQAAPASSANAPVDSAEQPAGTVVDKPPTDSGIGKGPIASRRRWLPLGALVTALLVVLLFIPVFLLVSHGNAQSPGTATPSPTLNAPAATQTGVAFSATATSAAATATSLRAMVAATATAVFVAPYVAAQPGPCDQGGATWQSAENNGQFPGKMSCTADSLAITGHAWAEFEGTPGRAGFSSEGIPPLHFRASVDVSFGSGGSNGSPLIVGQFDAIAYIFQIHSNGTWMLSVYNNAQYMGGNTGQTRATANYTLAMTAQSGFVTFFVNGKQVDKIKLASGGEQSTGVFIGNDSGGPVYCKNFVFTPLS